MLTRDDIITILEECKKVALKKTNEDQAKQVELIHLDILPPSKNFIGRGNPAIFVNKTTYKYLGKEHKNWIPNKTIAVDETIFKEHPLKIIGMITHEIGHAFSVATNVANTEANAYIFEIKLMMYLFRNRHSLLSSYSKDDLGRYFEMRLSQYQHANHSPLLDKYINEIRQKTILENNNNTLRSYSKMTHSWYFFRTSNTMSCNNDMVQTERMVNLAKHRL